MYLAEGIQNTLLLSILVDLFSFIFNLYIIFSFYLFYNKYCGYLSKYLMICLTFWFFVLIRILNKFKEILFIFTDYCKAIMSSNIETNYV